MNCWKKRFIICIFSFCACFNNTVAIGASSQDNDIQKLHVIENNILASERLFGFIDQEGRIICPPMFYHAWEFHNGLARVQPTSSEKYGFIDTTGAYVVLPELADAADFSEGLAAVKSEANGLYGYINTDGEIVIPPKYSRAFKFINGRGRVNIDGVTAYIDKSGNELMRTPYLKIWDTEGDMISFFSGRNLGFMNQDGKVIVEPKYFPVIYWANLMFTEPITPVGLEKKYGFIDKTGKVVVDFQYDWVYQFKEGLATVSKDNQYGFIDTSGKVIIPLQFEEAWYFSENLAAVKVNNRWGFINKQGRMVIQPQFLTPRFGGPIYFHEGLAAVRTENGSGYINKQGDMVIAPVYSYAGEFSGGVAEVRFRSICYINRQGEYLWPPNPKPFSG